MNLTTPFTVFCEMIWCATEVSGMSFAEASVFLLLMGLMTTMLWHMWTWQKKIMVLVQSVQAQQVKIQEEQGDLFKAVLTQLQDVAFQNQRGAEKVVEELYEQCNVLAQFHKPSNMLEACRLVVEALSEKIGDAHLGMAPDASGTQDDSQFKKQVLEIIAKLAALQGMATEIAAMHKLLNTHSADLSKLGSIASRSVETHGLLLQVNGDVLTKKHLTDEQDRLHKALAGKIEELNEKTAVLRVVVEQNRDKILQHTKDNCGWVNKTAADLTSIVRGTLVPQQKQLLDMVYSGREASTMAQSILQSCSESVQGCEDRLVRLEPLVTGLIDQANECDERVRIGFEAVLSETPALSEILQRLPKLPQRKPPSQERAPDSASSSQAPTHPTTPPTTLGPQPVAQPAQQPTVIPVTLETQGTPHSSGIQLRLSEHVGAVQAQAPPQLLVDGGGRQPNFLITPLPQTNPGGDLLRAMLR